MSEEDLELEDENEESLWAETADGVFAAALSPFGPKLPPGNYTIGQTSTGDIRFIKKGARDEPLLRFPGAVDDIIKEIDFFWSRKEVYKALNLPFRRGILLYGPPGSGKTSVLRLALEDVAERGGIGIIFNNIALLSDGYPILRSIQPDTPVIVVIEDLDNYCGNTYQESMILDFLDGVAEGASNTVFIATTNYIDKLPDRIKNRPSRFDKKFEIGFPVADHRLQYMQRLIDSIPAGLDTYQDRLPIASGQFVTDTEGLSLAHVKELFIAVSILGNSYEEAIEALRSGIEAADLDSSPVCSEDFNLGQETQSLMSFH